ncbi:transmembrane protein 131 homolog [Eupeodes corollae]|uniref:transmembrane protein 131 homolog n=1 Tax=Eupeodes corollae TaxID=290404 RepID=UPI00249340AC|nr:transmembrane protein 131 homolog [Eupeodes corollae]
MLLLTLLCLLHSALIDCQLDKVDNSYQQQQHRNQPLHHQDIYVENIPLSSSSSSNTDGAAATSSSSSSSTIDVTTDIASELYRSLSFQPSSLDFGAWSIGTAQSHVVTLVNKNENSSVYLSSVSGKTADFYSSFFQDKVVPPRGNTTFNVVFLPRSHGAVETNLLIHTSFGQARLLVKGEGRECPYRLKPLVGIRAPLNSTLSPEIHMYNPHTKPLQIVEVYSSGGQFQLELPSGGQEGPQDLWEIPPHSTKPIIRIRFNGINPGNHTAYIRIKIAGSDDDGLGGDNILVIPVEFEILTTYGLFSPMPVIDFGRLTTKEKMHTFKVELKNSGKSPVNIIDYELRNIEFPISINRLFSEITLDPSTFQTSTIINGELVVKSAFARSPKEIMELVLYVRAEVFNGALEFNKNITRFITKSQNFTLPHRHFWVVNNFSEPLAILNVTTSETINPNPNPNGNETSAAFKISNFVPIVLQPGQNHTIFEITLLNETANDLKLLQIITNVTTYRLPVIVCTGLLDFYTIDTDDINMKTTNSVLDLGTVPFGEMSHSGYVVIKNSNPIPLEVVYWDFSSPQGVYFHSTFLGCLKTKKEENKPLSESKFELCFKLNMGDVAVYQIGIQSYQAKSLSGNLKIRTEHEQIVVTVKFDTIMGRLEIDQSKLHFGDCFPGKRCSAEISFHSTFIKPMRVNSIIFSDSGLQFEDNDAEGTWIMPNTVTNVGKIYFDPRSLCQSRCYIPFNQTLAPLFTSLESHLNFDETELRRRTEIFRHFKYYLKTITFTVNTSEVRLFKFNLTVDIIWPKLVSGVQTLPTVEIGQAYVAQIVLNNPSDTPLLVDFFISNPTVSKNTKLSLPLEVVEICPHCYLTDKHVFSLAGVHKPRVIQPKSSFSANIEFMAKEPGVFSTIMHIRNNLTLYEAVWVTAKAVRSQFKFGNKKPGSLAALTFDVGEKHMSGCLLKEQQNPDTTREIVSIRRSFIARNTGEVPILVLTFMIDDQYCEGYGFKVIDCHGFALKSNSSKKIDIAFTPDFTLARVMRPLIIRTNLSYLVNYTLMASMTPAVLEHCSKSIQRPPWESRIKQIAIFMLATAFVFVLIAGHLDSDKVLTDHVQNISRDKGPLQPTLNLRNIAMQASSYDEAGDTARNSRVAMGKGINNAISFRKRSNKKGFPVLNNNLPDRSWAQELAKLGVRPKEVVSTPQPSKQPVAPNRVSPTDKLQKSKGSPKESEKSPASTVPESSPVDKEKSSPPKIISKSDCSSMQVTPSTDIKKIPKQSAKKSKANSIQSQSSQETSAVPSETSPVKEVTESKQPTDDRPTPVRRTKSPKTTNKTETSAEKKSEQVVKLQTTPEIHNVDSRSINGSSTPISSTHSSVGGGGGSGSGGGKKYGKTPGRERKKEQSNGSSQSKRFDRKVSKFKPNAFHFSSPVSNTGPAPMSMWDPNQQASFSDVVAAAKVPSTNDMATLYCDDFMSEYLPMENTEWNDADLKNDETFGDSMIVPTPPMANNSNGIHKMGGSNELGPIGTKRSPASTPNWEPFNVLKPTACNNSSFFSNVIPTYMYRDANQYLGRNQASYEQDFSGPGHLQNQWNPNNEYFASQQQQLAESHKHPTANWSNGNGGSSGGQTWDPMGYQQAGNAANTWQRPPIRPPPGLEFPKRDSPIVSLQDQMSPTPFGQQQQTQPDSDPPFNPIFSSLSNIWSDNWNKNKNNNNNN